MASWEQTSLQFTNRLPTAKELVVLQQVLEKLDYDTPKLGSGTNAMDCSWRSPLFSVQDTANLLTTLGFPCIGVREGHTAIGGETHCFIGLFAVMDLLDVHHLLVLSESNDCRILSTMSAFAQQALADAVRYAQETIRVAHHKTAAGHLPGVSIGI